MKYVPFVVAAILFGCPAVRADVGLWFSKDDLPGLRQTITQGKEAEIWQSVLQRADEYCTPGNPRYADPAVIAESPASSPRVQVLGHYFGRRLTQWMECLGFAYQVTGDEKYARHGILLLEAAAEKLPVTSPDIAKGFAGARGDIMRGLAVGYDWLGEAMTPEQKAAWAETSAAYVRNIIAEVSQERVWWRPYHNFMGVALGAAGLLSLKLQEFYPDEAPEWTGFLAERITLWLDNGFDARGAYVEGTTYGVYGLSNALRFADALRRAGGANLLEHRHLRGVPHFFTAALLPGESVFDARNDASYATFRDATLLLLAREHGNGLAKWLWERAGDDRSPFVIIWANDVPPATPTEAGEPLAEHFEDRGLCVWRTGWGRSDVMFATEAGPYFAVTHDQADEGHFALYGLGYRWCIDSGYGNTGLPGGRDQTVAHNCVLIDGQGMARSGAGAGTSGKLVEYRNDDVYGYARIDATEAYNRNHRGQPGAVVEYAERHTLFIRPSHGAPAYAVVLDDIRKDDQQHKYTWLMHTPADMHVKTDGRGALLSPEAAMPMTLIETPDDATGRGESTWTFQVEDAGDYTVWGRVRAAGAVAAQSDSFLVQMDDGPCIDWHIAARRNWIWCKVGAGVPSQPASYTLERGAHTLRFFTREPGTQLEQLVLSAAPDAGPPFMPGHGIIALSPADAAVTAPMRCVHKEEDSDAPRMRVWISAAATQQCEVDRYDDHRRLNAHTTAVQPEFIAVLLPLPAHIDEPDIAVLRDQDAVLVRIDWPGRKDVIAWPRAQPRQPTVTTTSP